MRKKFLLAFLVLILTVVSFSGTIFAERKETLPVTMIAKPRSKSSYPIRIDSFTVTKVENLAGEGLNRIYYDFEYDDFSSYGRVYVNLNCYDAMKNLLKTIKFYGSDKYVDVPEATATIEFIAENPPIDSQSYLYCNYVNVYAPDGRSLKITDLQVPVYKKKGWIEKVTMYAYENGKFDRSIEVFPEEVDAYRQVGWYTGYEVKNAETMYAKDETGTNIRTLVVPERLVSTYRQVGWFTKNEFNTQFYRKTSLPVTLKNRNGAETRIDSFEITSIEAISAYNMNVKFKIKGNKFNGKYWDSIHVICYDVNGIYIETKDMTYIYDDKESTDDVMLPINTAMIELVANDPIAGSQSYFYTKYVNICAPDGRTMGVTDLQVPLYEQVGWYRI